MNRITFYGKVYLACILQDVKIKMSYRVDFFIGLVGVLATNISLVATFWVVFKNIQHINGWNYYEMLFIYAIFLLATAPFHLIFDNIWSLEQHLIEGTFMKYYFRPINIFFYYISETFNVKALGQVVFGLIFMVFTWSKLDLAVTWNSIIGVIFQMMGGSMVYAAIMIIVSAISFWAVNYNSILSLIFRLADYSVYPFSIFGTVIRALFTWILPLSFIAYYPTLNILKPDQISFISSISPLVGVVLFVGAYKFWMYGARMFAGTGS